MQEATSRSGAEVVPGISEVVHQLTDLTRHRDRDRLDITLVSVLRSLLKPKVVSLWSSLGEVESQRWFKRAELRREDTAATSDSIWVDIETLPVLTAHPLRLQCLRSQQMQTCIAGQAALSLFAIGSDTSSGAVLEIETDTPLGASEQQMVGGILRIYQNFQSVLDYSECDTLTGLLNRKTFDESFFKAVKNTAPMPAEMGGARGVSSERSVYLGVIDIDHFKRVNDTYGHLIGDEVLLLLSRLMRSTFRFSDRLYRFGGEEFLVMMHCPSEHEAMLAFERLRSNTEGYPFPQVGTLTISIGFTKVSAGDMPSTAFQRADQALYYAKSHGRNQVQSHAVLVLESAVSVENKTGDVELF
ncbi:MAG: GGDEF domain-containing protein [Betaproteobacteria bacterium]|nr:GGDEF domain-containing protein [Betaproteobacteria bacterium]